MNFIMKNKKSVCTLSYFIIISILELLAYKFNGIFSITASWLWLFTGLSLFIFLLVESTRMIINDIKNRNIINLIGYAILLLLFIFFIGNISYSDISYESAIQVNAGLKSFEMPDLNYTKTAFLGYPNRQYILIALPALVFGRNIFTLHAGFGIIFLASISALYIELRKILENKQIKPYYALLVPYLLLCFGFIIEYFLNFEQSIIPVVLTIFGISAYLRLRRDIGIKSLIFVSFIGEFLANSYTPSLASLGLLIVFLIIYIIEIFNSSKNKLDNNIEKMNDYKFDIIKIITVILCICTFFIATIISNRSDRFDVFNQQKTIITIAIESFNDLFFNYGQNFFGILMIFVIVYMLFAILGKFKIHNFIIAIWVLAVSFFAHFLPGYAEYSGIHLLQRCMIVLPVLTTTIFLLVMNFLKKHNIEIKSSIISIILLLCFGIGIYNFNQPHKSFTYFNNIQAVKYVLYYAENTLKEYNLKPTDDFYIILYTDNILESNLYDYATFFFPNAKTISKNSNESIDEIDLSKFVMVFSENKNVLSNIKHSKNIDSKTFDNPRYKKNMTIYRTIINQK